MNKVQLTSGAWFGDRSLTLNFPPQWEVEVFGNDILPPLSPAQIIAKIVDPIGTQKIHELAINKQRVVIVVDDITRPTPAALLIPPIIQELEKGGVRRGSVSIVIAGATHAPASEKEIELKLGKEIASTVNVIGHDAGKNIVFLGNSSRGLPIYVNKHVVDSDLLIGVGCIYPHPAAGFSGGSKIVAPGVCGGETVRYLHDYMKSGTRGRYQADREFNQETLHIANKVGLDFIVNVVLNQRREIAGLFAGDKVQAHEAGCRFAMENFSVKPVKKGTDVVILDAYPFDTSFQFAKDRGLWLFEGLSNNVSKVVIADFPGGLGDHVLYPVNRQFSARLSRRLKNLHPKDFRFLPDKLRAIRRLISSKKQRIMFLSNGITTSEIKSVFPKATGFKEWDDIIKELSLRHKDIPVRVAVYRCTPYLIVN